MDDMQEILEDFLVEAFELIEQIDHDLIELEARPETAFSAWRTR